MLLRLLVHWVTNKRVKQWWPPARCLLPAACCLLPMTLVQFLLLRLSGCFVLGTSAKRQIGFAPQLLCNPPFPPSRSCSAPLPA